MSLTREEFEVLTNEADNRVIYLTLAPNPEQQAHYWFTKFVEAAQRMGLRPTMREAADIASALAQRFDMERSSNTVREQSYILRSVATTMELLARVASGMAQRNQSPQQGESSILAEEVVKVLGEPPERYDCQQR